MSISNTPIKKQRDSNLELFRIITMLVIIAHHYVVNSGLLASSGPVYSNLLSIRSQFLLALGAFGKTGINCFVLITGYFMCKSRINDRKFGRLLMEAMFYQVLIHAVFWISGYAPFSWKALINMFFPIRSIALSFTECYFVFFLCIPFLNALLRNLNERQHIRLLILCTATYVFFGTMPSFSIRMNYVSWFIVLYFIAAYFRIYPRKIFENTRLWGILTLVFAGLSLLSVGACSWLSAKLNRNMVYTFVTDSNTFLALATGISAFLFFKNIKLRYVPMINTLAASSFGVLLIHTHSDQMRQWLWQDVLQNVRMYASAWLPLHAIGSVIVIFLICAAIDHLRIRYVENIYMCVWSCVYERAASLYRRLEGKLLSQAEK